MIDKRARHKGRRTSKTFFGFPHECIRHSNYISLSAYAVKLLIDLGAQYNGKNNGDLCAPWSIMKDRGWNSQATLHRAKNELIDKGWIVTSRQGGRHKCSLFALSFQAIDECKGKLDINSTNVAPGNWKN
jgi:hypothetical protein